MSDPAEIESLAAALIEANDQLIGLYDLADLTARSLDEHELVADILHRSMRILRADSLLLVTPDQHVSVGIAHSHLFSGEAQRTTSVQARQSGGMTGELRAARSDGAFSTGDRKLLGAVLRTVLAAIETARLHGRALTSALHEQEQRRAAEVAQLALPAGMPSIDGVDVWFGTDQAQLTGGDLFTYHLKTGSDFDGRTGDTASSATELMFAVGDVSGKGLPAAVMMTTAVCALNAAFRERETRAPGEQLQMVNDWMFDHLDQAGAFATLFIGHYRPRTGELAWANAGHSPCAVSRRSGTDSFAPTTPPIGVTPTLRPVTNLRSLEHGDVALIGSDGLTEQSAPDGQKFGELRLHNVIEERSEHSAEAIAEAVLEAVNDFANGTPQSDDRTVMVLKHGAAS